jgi:hypothetical protein
MIQTVGKEKGEILTGDACSRRVALRALVAALTQLNTIKSTENSPQI